MALIKCDECGGDISSKAEVCPHCGFKEKKTGCLGMIGYLILGLILISLLGKCALDRDQVTVTTKKVQTQTESPTQIAKEYFKINSGDKFLTCGTVISAVVKKESATVKDYLITCSNKETYRFIQEHMDMYKGKPADRWFTHAFKCSDLKGSTLVGWHNPKDWGITKENCSSN